MSAAANNNNGGDAALWRRVLRSLGAATGLFVAVSAGASVVAAQDEAYRSAATAPATWQAFAAQLQGRFEQRLAADDRDARLFQDYMAKRDTESNAPALTFVARAWVLPDGTPGAKIEASDNSVEGGLPSQRNLDSHTSYRALIEKEASGTGLVPEIAEAVMAVESGYNPGAIGGVGEIGLMQILPSTARMLGFVGSNADLAVPETNVHYGVMYLAQAWRLSGGDLCTAVMKYRAGHGESRFSYLSVNYCLAVRGKLAARGFRVTGTVPVATFGEAGRGVCKRKCVGGGSIGSVNLAVLNTKLSALVMQVRPKR